MNSLGHSVFLTQVRVKICGITSLEDALAALDAGADMLGFNFYEPSPRYLTPRACAQIQGALRSRGRPAVTVGVFVNAECDYICEILDDCGLDLAQLSGDEPADLLAALGERAFKALRPASPEAAQAGILAYGCASRPAPAFLLDASRPGQYGGSGQVADWDLARALSVRHPFLLAGGLRPENVAAAVRRVRPWGVDVASGVEAQPGRKDPAALNAFVSAVHEIGGFDDD
jgi:phosphoribosylanthranilate isomerase